MTWSIWWFGGFGFGVWRSVWPQGPIWSVAIGPATILMQWTHTKEIQCDHEPLLELDGKKITGSHRCKKCGLNESYWSIKAAQSGGEGNR